MSNEKKNDGGPAFPLPIAGATDGGVYTVMEANAGEFGGMTLRQYACIHLRVPDTGERWLDDIIRKAQRDHFAAKAMQALLGSQEMAANTVRAARDEARADTALYMAEVSYQMADCMLEVREQQQDNDQQ